MNEFKKIKCIIFDCDGTLVDSEFLCNLALEIKLKDYHVECSASQLLTQFRGGKLANIMDALEKEHNIRFDEAFVDQYRLLVDQLFEKELKACKGVKVLLDQLTLPICVASSGPKPKIQKALNVTGLAHYFNDHIYSSYDINSWKPNPGIFLHAAKSMGFDPIECLVIEDSILGVTAAKAAGMKHLLYDPSGIHINNDDWVIINNMKEVLTILEIDN